MPGIVNPERTPEEAEFQSYFQEEFIEKVNELSRRAAEAYLTRNREDVIEDARKIALQFESDLNAE